MNPSRSIAVSSTIIFISLTFKTACVAVEPVSYLTEIRSASEFELVSVPHNFNPNINRVGKFILPAASSEGLLPTVYQNVNLFQLHYDFLAQVFPEFFLGLTEIEYLATVLRRNERRYYAGSLCSVLPDQGAEIYGFDVAIDPLDPSQLLTVEETRSVYETLSNTFRLRPLCYVPTGNDARVEAMNWENPGFPIYFPGDDYPSAYEAYTTGTNYGRVRNLTLNDLERLNLEGGISWQDLLVIDSSPADIEGVFAAVITGKPQGELSHLAIRSARRGSPNAYIEDAASIFAPYEGELVRLDLTNVGYSIDSNIAPSDAEEWWRTRRPILPNIPNPDLAYAAFDNLLEMDRADTLGDPASRFGGKAANLARMYSFLPSENQVPGFAIPFRYYHEFMTSNYILDDRSDPPRLASYDEYLNGLFTDPTFQVDGCYRMSRLAAFQDYAKRFGAIDPLLVQSLIERIEVVFGPTDTMVRFRSSSNVEDCLAFNGAGLYDSTSVCPGDTLDGDDNGPSRCYPDQDKERSVERGLREVWTSLWNFRAYEERSYYQVPQDRASMGILVTTAFPDEAANGVAFTGDPILGATAGYSVSVQVGDESVVQPHTDVLPERDILEMASGEVVSIRRVRGSTLLPDEGRVLTEDQLRLLGRTMAMVDQAFSFDLEGHARDQVLLDIEFKFTKAGDLIFKQVRPFLLPSVPPPHPSEFCQLVIRDATKVNGWFQVGSRVQQRLQSMATVELQEGIIFLPRERPVLQAPLIRKFCYGPNLAQATPLSNGRFSSHPRNGKFTYTFDQTFQAGNEVVTLNVSLPTFRADEFVKVLGENELLWETCFTGTALGESNIEFAPENLDQLPLWGYDLNLTGGWRLLLEFRQLPNMIHTDYRDALVGAEVWTPEGHQRIDDYSRLVHTRENPDLLAGSSWILLERPVGNVSILQVDWERTVSGPSSIAIYGLKDESGVVGTFEILSPNPPPGPGARLNEIMALNSTTLVDESGDFDPWIELHNPTDATVELDALFLSNDPLTPRQWRFPTGSGLKPHGFLVVWVDGETDEGLYHASFRLGAASGSVSLWDGNLMFNQEIDWTSYDLLTSDRSWGRRRDGEGEFSLLDAASPHGTNDVATSSSPTPTLSPSNTPTPLPNRFPSPNDVIFNEYWNNDDGTRYASLSGRPLYGDWLELLVVDPEGVDLRGWRITNNPNIFTSDPFDESGSVLLPSIPEFSLVSPGVVILFVVDNISENNVNFPIDDLDASDGSLLLYAGNGLLDVTRDPGFTVHSENDSLVLLRPGNDPGYEDDIGIDFVGEGHAITPGLFGVSAHGVEWDHPFTGIGSDDGAIFTQNGTTTYMNDDGFDPNSDDPLPGAGGWIVDPPKEFTGENGGENILTPGGVNFGQPANFHLLGDMNGDLGLNALDLFEISRIWFDFSSTVQGVQLIPRTSEGVDERALLLLLRSWRSGRPLQ